MIRNFKRTAAIFGIVAATSTALVACSEESGSSSDSAGGEDVSGELVGEGASSQQNAMSYFGTAFGEDHPDANLSYTASGSGSGVKSFINGQAAFAGSDSALKEDEGEVEAAKERCDGNDAWHLPSTIGPVAIAYNLGDTEINLSTKTLAKIFKGEIKKWNDKAIAGDNEGTDLPDTDIKVVYRSDESGTSDNFQKFLKASSGEWDSEGKQFPDAVGEGADKSTGVADAVASTEGAITYVESGFADQKEGDGVKKAKIDFGHGPVELSTESVNKALENLEFKETDSEHNMVVDSEALFSSDNEGAYPLILTTYNIVCSKGYDEETSKLVKSFFTTVLDHQDDQLAEQGFIPVEGAHLDKLKAAVDALQ
ncbi:phosphate ABC transporter substrate-binding protein PstS [Corynebacterium tuberculostearicum]|uniref:phosphate ABC transporter substrate-binding protein PstS n=1 Tax=Corynebacterium TaxID=1716 RepID=UPI001EF2A4B6|nr:phosphate ABC transporter substrate-binding protein PstS [Corynebacterium tuberculostearicum]MCG7466386.1 phosphate ABC transporter substrate-binding protein PstS [Corynebacterium sp. ACRPJ]WKE52522.1 phosphate ABC transporter substrate-binding protein PstS [Corynebacterium tuberculostearicum]